MSKHDGKDGQVCEDCDGWVDYTDLGSVFMHEHKGLSEPWGIKGVKVSDTEMLRMLAVLDLETGTADVESCPIREIALLPLDDDLEPMKDGDVWYGFIDTWSCAPGQQDAGAFGVHKIPVEEGGSFVAGKVALEAWLGGANKWGVPLHLELVGHNVGVFDQPVLRRFLGHRLYSRHFSYRVRDTAVVAKFMLDADVIPREMRQVGPFKNRWRVGQDLKLKDVCRHFDVPDADVHRALPDAVAEAALYRAMVTSMELCWIEDMRQA